jgi:sugar lactone lactonase YvrE
MVFVTNPQAAQIAPLNLLRKTANMNAPVRFRQPVGKALSPSHLNTPLRVAQMVPRPPAVSLHGRYSAGTRAVMHSLCALFIWFAIPQLLKAQGGTVTVVAGLPGQYGYSGDGAAATNALMDSPVAAVVASDGTVYIADYYNAVVRKIDPKNGFISTFAGGGGCSPNSNGYCGAGGMADNAVLSAPVSLALDAQGSLYIADQGAGVIFKVSTLLGVSTITSIVGQGDNSCYPASASDSCPAGTSGLGVINGIAIDPVRSLLYLSNDEGQILKVNLAANVVSLEAGVYEAYAYDGDNGPAVDAKLNIPEQVALDSAGSLYFADTSNNVIRKITLGGVITTVAGTGTASFDGDGGKGTLAKLNTPFGVAVDPSGNLYIADTGNARIRMVDAVTGTIGTIAGSSAVGCVLQKDALGDGCSPLLTNMAHISSLAVDSANYIYLAGRYDFGSGLPDPTLGNDETVRKLPVVTATPTFIPAAGYYLDPPYVQITDSTINASIYYTLDGTTPTTSSAKFDPNYPIAVPFGATTIQAIAVAPGYSPSLVNIAAYVTGVPAPPAPTFAPTPGAYIGAQTITLTDANVSAAIYFTTDGTTPTTSSNHYITGFILSTSQTVKAIAVLSGYAKSAVTTGTYTINYPIVAPSVSVMPGSSSITTLQSLTVTVTVGGAPGYPAPTGSVTVTCGTYSSLSAVISSGSADHDPEWFSYSGQRNAVG